MSDLLRVYLDPGEIAPDGYPEAWHGYRYVRAHSEETDNGIVLVGEHRARLPTSIKDLIREQAEHRCVRCGHPYRKGEHGNGEWSPCDGRCTHRGPIRLRSAAIGDEDPWREFGWIPETASEARLDESPTGSAVRYEVEAAWRILTVHHLNGVKHDCRWWNLAALDQRCHLYMQSAVIMDRPFEYEHSDWFKSYVAGFYAWKYLGEELTREETTARLDELLALERRYTREPLF